MIPSPTTAQPAHLQAQTNFLTQAFAGQNVLVTGGAGFIGSHLTERLVKLGAHVTVLDNLSSGSRAHLAAVYDSITFKQGTVTDLLTCIDAAFKQAYIFHLAAMVSVPGSIDDPAACYAVNTMGTVNVLEAARRQSVPNVFFASSSAVYGNQNIPCSEEMLGKPESPYGSSKLMGELLCQQYKLSYGLSTVNGRFFNVYGPRQSALSAYAGVVARFRQSMAEGQPIMIFGDGLQKRDFIDVHTVVEGSLTLAALPPIHVAGHSINIATGSSISILELFNTLRQEYPHYAHKPLLSPARAGDIPFSQADCSKYYRLIELAQAIL